MVGRPARRPDRTTAVNSGRRRRRACAGNTSGGELLAALATTAGEDRAARTGAHPQPEAVGLGPTTVVRLERALAHEGLPLRQRCGRRCRTPPGGGPRRAGADGAALRTRKLVSADRPHRSAGRPARGPLRGRQGPSTDLSSIAEVRRVPVAGTTTTADGHPRGAVTARRRAVHRSRRARPTRRNGPRCRCPAVDGAVSVAVAPSRRSGFRRAGRPRRSTDRRAPAVRPRTRF